MDEIIKKIPDLILKNLRHSLPILLPFLIFFAQGKEELAIFTLSLLIVQMVYRLVFLPTQDPFLRSIKDSANKFDIKKTKEFSSVVLVYGSLGILIAVILLFTLENFVHIFINNENLLIPIVIATIGISYRTYYETLLIATTGIRRSQTFVATTVVLSIIIVISLWPYGNLNSFYSLLTIGIVPIIVSLFFNLQTVLNSTFPIRFKYSNTKLLFGKMKWFLIGSLSLFLIKWIDIIILRYFGEIIDIGRYNMVYQVFILLGLLSLQIPGVLTESYTIFLDNKDGRERYFKKYKKYVFPIWIALTLVLLMCAIMVSYTIKPIKADLVHVFILLLVTSLFHLFVHMFQPIFRQNKKFNVLQKSFFIGLIVNAIADVILIPTYGMLGASIATMSAFGSSAVFVLYYYKTKLFKQ